ncbi:MAG TPA: MFS transporter, partial [Anaerolineaceae bacterium]|nr:MFS transporter [Anaerolineaceae bacterium]
AAFTKNARLYLIGSILLGIVMGIFQLLFNFYVLSLGFNQEVLGTLVAFRSATSLITALPIALLVNKIGKRNAFIMGNLLIGAAIGMMLLFPGFALFCVMNALIGLAQTLSAVGMGPFLMENSSDYERTYLFSVASGINMTAISIGEWVGGYMPTWFGSLLNVASTTTRAYSATLGLICLGAAISVIPFLFITNKYVPSSGRSIFKLDYLKYNPKGLSRLILPLLITSIGAGMIMPFMNVFFRTAHGQSDAAIGTFFAWGALAMAMGLLAAPVLAERFGKIKVVVLSQALSIPFLVLLGFTPFLIPAIIAYYVRATLMNMSSPVYSTYVMEKVPDESRAMAASLTSMSSNFGWAISPVLSGWLQIRGGFKGPFLITIATYSLAVLLYYLWHWRGDRPAKVGLAG